MLDASGFSISDPPIEGDDEAVARLSKLPALDYERQREAEAERLGLPPDRLPSDAVTARDTVPAVPPADPQAPSTEIDL